MILPLYNGKMALCKILTRTQLFKLFPYLTKNMTLVPDLSCVKWSAPEIKPNPPSDSINIRKTD